MTYCNAAEQQLIRILKSRKTSLSANELAAMLGMGNRQTRAMVAHLRDIRDGYCFPILSTSRDGYYYAYAMGSEKATIAQLKARQENLQAAIDGIIEGMEREFGYPCQMKLEEAG